MAGGSVRVVFDGPALRRVTITAAKSAVAPRANRVLNAARRNTPVDTGRLRAALAIEYVDAPNAIIARIGSNLAYAKARHEGTGIYGPRGMPIRPKAGQFLRWPAINNSGSGNRRYRNGRTASWVFAREVKGTPGVPYLRDALAAAR